MFYSKHSVDNSKLVPIIFLGENIPSSECSLLSESLIKNYLNIRDCLKLNQGGGAKNRLPVTTNEKKIL